MTMHRVGLFAVPLHCHEKRMGMCHEAAIELVLAAFFFFQITARASLLPSVSISCSASAENRLRDQSPEQRQAQELLEDAVKNRPGKRRRDQRDIPFFL